MEEKSILSQIKFSTYKNLGSIINVLAVILIVIGMIFVNISNAVPGYGLDSFSIIMLSIVIGLVAAILTLLFEPILGSQHFVIFLIKLVAILGIFIGLSLILYQKIIDASALFTWDKGNEVGMSAFVYGVVSISILLASNIALVVTSFFKEKI